MNLPIVTRIDTNARTHDLGRFNVSTTDDAFIETTNWIDVKLSALFECTTPNDTLDDSDFPSPVGMGRKKAHRPPKTTKPSAYIPGTAAPKRAARSSTFSARSIRLSVNRPAWACTRLKSTWRP
jgi:hypothetical protein